MTIVEIRMKIAEHLEAQGNPAIGEGSPFIDLMPIIQLSGMDGLEFDGVCLTPMEERGLIEVESRRPYRARLSSLGYNLLLDDELEQHLDPSAKKRDESSMRKGFDLAQVCLNGHVITRCAAFSPQFRKKFCPQCGSKTITECPGCSKDIQGLYHVLGEKTEEETGQDITAPAFCHSCGQRYPWTTVAIDAAKELAYTVGLSEVDADALARTIDDLVGDTPRTPLAVERFKGYAEELTDESLNIFKDILKTVLKKKVLALIFGAAA